jgi:hypothetical protein
MVTVPAHTSSLRITLVYRRYGNAADYMSTTAKAPPRGIALRNRRSKYLKLR